MALNCKNCVFGKAVEGSSHHMSCRRFGVNIAGVNEHGVKNGWFMFPIDYDVIWAETCDGFIPSNWEELSSEEKVLILTYEFNKIQLNKTNPERMIPRNEDIFKDPENLEIIREELSKEEEPEERVKGVETDLKNLIEKFTLSDKAVLAETFRRMT